MTQKSAKTIKPGSRAQRDVAIRAADVDLNARTVAIAFSSEAPVRRWFGNEILSHGAEAVRLGRLQDGGPLLMDHNTRDHLGVIESVQIGADRVGRAVVRFGRSARAEEVFQDVQDGIRRHVSVGYVIHRAELVETGEDQDDTYRVTDWEPLEVSLVSVPADPSVGVGRAHEALGIEIIEPKVRAMPDQAPTQSTPETREQPRPVDTDAIARQAAERAEAAANKRVQDIMAIGRMFSEHNGEREASEAIAAGISVEAFKDRMLERAAAKPLPTADIGMGAGEVKRYSWMRALNALANPADRRAQEAASFERECSEAVGDKLGREARGFFVPQDVQRRDLTVGTSTAGGHTVSTDLLAADFIDLLRNRLMVMRMGAQLLSGLMGNIAIPRQTSGATAYWVAESGSPTESQQAFDQVTMSPKTVGAFSDISRKLLLQSSLDIEAFVRNDLARVLALAIDLAAISGTGASNQPTGILNTSGIGDVAGGTNGAAPDWADIIELWSDIAVANADTGNVGILTNAKVVGKLMGTEKATGTAQFVCPSFPDADGMTNFGGLRVGVSNQVPSNLTKGTSSGVCSALISGVWSDLIIGQWGSLDLMVDPYTNSTSGTVRVVALQDIDIAVRHAVSFSAMKDALTA